MFVIQIPTVGQKMKITRRLDDDLASALRETSTRRSHDAGRRPRHRCRPVLLTSLRQTGFCRRSNPEAADRGVGSTEREVQPHPEIETRPGMDKSSVKPGSVVVFVKLFAYLL